MKTGSREQGARRQCGAAQTQSMGRGAILSRAIAKTNSATNDGETQPVAAGLPVLHCRGRLAYWLRAQRRMLRDVREFGDQVSAEIQAIYATSIRYWSAKVNAGGAL